MWIPQGFIQPWRFDSLKKQRSGKGALRVLRKAFWGNRKGQLIHSNQYQHIFTFTISLKLLDSRKLSTQNFI
ncbi:hypothetical protein WA1_34130 [Scytonema hofmannii PCC 7110]|uniref:Uncharacterized protein n=1 Tax=Scytonema hofmannii PCC 7110 TaxID=128403 RepID=A0A139X2Z1_9CYAN|nr:hypothetical protein WA1_34130 [Scytonema hofmannii PCC 7110]